MTDPKKPEDTKKPDSTTDQPKKDEGTVKAAEVTTTKAAEPAKIEAPKAAAEPANAADGGANIQTKHEGIKSDQDFTKDDVGDEDPEHTPPETIDDNTLKAAIGDVAFAGDANGDDTTATKSDEEKEPVRGSVEAAQPSIDRLKSLVYAYPKDASGGTVVFGYGGISITIGDLRAVVSIL